MKKYQLFKIMATSLGIASLVGIGATSIVGCAKKSSPNVVGLAKFIKAAQAESANNIVTNAKPAAPNWENLSAKSGDLKIQTTTSKAKIVSVIIKSISKSEVATFSATYTGSAYTNSIWVCSQPPANSDGKAHSWVDFKTIAIRDSATNIFKQASSQKTNWDITNTISIFKAPVANDANKTLTVTLVDRQKTETVNFVATYTTNRSFQSSDWASSQTPVSNKDNLTFKKINLPNPNQTLTDDNIIVSIWGITYLGGMGGLWTSTDNKTWTKNSSINISNHVRVTGIVLWHLYIVVSTEVLDSSNTTEDKGGFFISRSDGKPPAAGLFFQHWDIFSDSLIINNLLSTVGSLYFSTKTQGIFAISWQTDGPQILVPQEHIMNNTNTKLAVIRSIKLINNKIYLATATNGLWVSSETKKNTFIKVKLGSSSDNDAQELCNIDFITKIKGHNNIYVSVSKTSIGIEPGLYISSNQGDTFSNQFKSKTIGTSELVINNIDLIDNSFYLSTNQGLYIDSDISKRELTFNINDTLGKTFNVKNVIERQETLDTIYAATDQGLFTSAAGNFDYFTLNSSVSKDNVYYVRVIDGRIFIDISLKGDYINA